MICGLVFTSGAGMSFVRPDHAGDLGGVAAGEILELVLGEQLRVDRDAAFGAAERQPDDRALPGHPHRQGLDLGDRDSLVVADAALGRAGTAVVLDAVTGEDLDRAVVHLDREIDRQFALAVAQDAPHGVIEAENVGGDLKLLNRDSKQVDLLVGVIDRFRAVL